MGDSVWAHSVVRRATELNSIWRTRADSALQTMANRIDRNLTAMALSEVAAGEGDGPLAAVTHHLQMPIAKGSVANGGSGSWSGIGVGSLGHAPRINVLGMFLKGAMGILTSRSPDVRLAK
jgi:hypothetical protein